MASVTLRDLYAAELHDLMNAEKQLLAERGINQAASATVPSPGRELVMAHGEPEGRSPSTSLGAGEETDRHVPDSGDINPRATEQPST